MIYRVLCVICFLVLDKWVHIIYRHWCLSLRRTGLQLRWV